MSSREEWRNRLRISTKRNIRKNQSELQNIVKKTMLERMNSGLDGTERLETWKKGE